MIGSSIYTRASEAAAVVRESEPDVPRIAVVLGSGLGGFVDRLEGKVVVPYASIPHVASTTVAGHAGNLVVGAIGGVRLIAMQGRFHHYEGHDLAAATFPIRVLQSLGVKTLILTAATGGIRDGLKPGDLVGISDHLNLLGVNPLRGRNNDRLGIRFPDMTEVYSRRLLALADDEARRHGYPPRDRRLRLHAGPELRDARRNPHVADPGRRRGRDVDRPGSDRGQARRDGGPGLRRRRRTPPPACRTPPSRMPRCSKPARRPKGGLST